MDRAGGKRTESDVVAVTEYDVRRASSFIHSFFLRVVATSIIFGLSIGDAEQNRLAAERKGRYQQSLQQRAHGDFQGLFMSSQRFSFLFS